MTTELPVRILLVDDDEIDREAIRRHISRERLPFALTTASSEADALEALKKEIFDVVLLDYDLRISTGLDILPHVSSIPVIFITGSGSEEIAVEAMRRGAKDYLIKDPDRNYLTVLPLTISNVLEHRDSEKNLRESEARFRALTEKASDLVLIVNRDREMTYTSPSIRRLGFSAGEILGKKPRDFVHPDDLHFVLAALTETMQKPYKAVRMHEVRVKQKNGAWVWFEGLVTNMFEQPGINGIVFNGRDVSERKVIEEALYQSEERLKATLASISDLVFGLDDKGIFIDYHPPLDHKELYAPPEMFLGNPYKEVLPEHISTKLEKAIEEATASGAVRKIEYPLVVKGTSKWYEAKVTVRRNSHGKLKGVTVVVVDITERKMAREALKKAHDQLEQRVAERTKELIATNKKLLKEIRERKKSEDALRKSEEHLNKFMDSAIESFFLLDSNLNFLNINTCGLHLLGKKKSEVLGESLKDLVPGCIESGSYEMHLEVIRSGTPFTIEDLVIPLHGVELRTIMKSFKVGDGLGIILIDTTDSRRLEEQLRQAQKMEAIGSLAGGIAHDFNNILGVIMGYTYLAIDDILPDELITARNNLGQVLSAAERAKELVSQILTFSRKSGKKRQPLSLKESVEEVLKLLRSTLPATIDIRSHIKGRFGPVLANGTQIHQVIMNICTNAAQAMKKKGGTLTISLKKLDLTHTFPDEKDLKAGKYQQLIFSDTGPGMPHNVKERIFEPYFTTKKQGEGTGMGLAVVHGIVKGHGGDITVVSEPGKGTVFNIFLPVTQQKKEIEPDGDESVRGGAEHILLVDDEEQLVDMGNQILKKFGYNVVSFTDSLKALEAFRDAPEKFDLVITDLTMPGLTGLQLTAELKKINPGVLVVLCTGFSENTDEEKYKSLGIDAFILKPVTQEEMARVIREVLEKSKEG